MAMKHHPDRGEHTISYIFTLFNHTSPSPISNNFSRKPSSSLGGDPEEFKKISEAYEVLTDSQKREIYDQYGEEGLKDGFFPGGGGGGGAGGMPGYHPGNPEDIFAEFLRHMNGGGGGSMNRRPRKDPPHQMSLPCTLEELYTGRTKRMKISRRRIDASGAQREESETLNIDIKQGWYVCLSSRSDCDWQ